MNRTTFANPDIDYGAITTLDKLAAYFDVSLRALRPALARNGVPVVKIGELEYVQTAVLEQRLGLVPLDVLQGDIQGERYREHVEGMSAQEYSADVRRRTKGMPVRFVER